MLKLALILALAIAVQAAPSPISSSLRLSLATKGKVNVFLTLNERPSAVLSTLNLSNLSRDEKLNLVGATLKAHAKATQRSLVAFLATQQVTFKSFWISNQILVKNVDAELLLALAARPDVAKITENGSVPLEKPLDLKSVHRTKAVEWGVEIIGTPAVWATGNNGAGVVVANIDTGVRWTHRTLRDNYLGDYGWLDPYYGEELPTDNGGHGTHTMGTICGKEGIGVAPGAKWMACRGCGSFSCEFDTLLSCGEFMACPTDPHGENADCTKAPRIVSNSWGGGGGQDFYDDVVRVWNEVGIIGVFSNGNSGSFCSSVGSPADSGKTQVVGVGSTTMDEEVSYFSSVGPSVFGQIKPDIGAPGSDVISAYNTHDDAFTSMSGTSMAAPHVTGTLALILSAHPGYDYANATALLYGGATHTVQPTGGNCGGIPETEYPNNHVGHGRLSASGSLIVN